jgi:hypothetical protein
MKRLICFSFLSLFVLNFTQAKKFPDFVQQRLDSVKKEAKRSLERYRIWDVKIDGGYRWLPLQLGTVFSSGVFSYDETQLIDSLGLDLYVGLIYDDEMRNRIVQLMKNQYQEWELDSLVNRHIGMSVRYNSYEAFENCKFDTLQYFKDSLDNFYTNFKNKHINDSLMYDRYVKYENFYKKENRYEVFKLLQLDTTAIYKQSYNKIVEKQKKQERQNILNSTGHYRDYINLAELCGYINDKRFIQPLIDILNTSFNIDADSKEVVYKTVIEALVRLRIEPYYSDYVQHRTLTQEQIQDDKGLHFKLEDFVYVLRTQEAFLELSKYLISNKPYGITMVDYTNRSKIICSPASQEAFYLIQNNIENIEIQKMMKGENSYSDTKVLKQIYDWMQNNCRKYKIKRIW